MSDYRTTEEKLKDAEHTNTALLLLVVSVVVGFMTNAAIGATVFIVGIFVIQAFLNQKAEKQQALDKRLSLYVMGARIALRRIYFETSDEEIKAQVKRVAMEAPLVGGWGLLNLDQTDAEYQKKCEGDGSGALFIEAARKIEIDGPPFVVEGSRIVGMRPKW